MRRWVAAMVSVLALLVVVAPPAQGGGRRDRTFVLAECGRLRTTPPLIEFGCTGGLYLDHLTWFRWHRWRAAGGGLFHMNDCRPNCADGTYHTEWATSGCATERDANRRAGSHSSACASATRAGCSADAATPTATSAVRSDRRRSHR